MKFFSVNTEGGDFFQTPLSINLNSVKTTD
jgi:hypothetical protein